jgi:hypothetical protein
MQHNLQILLKVQHNQLLQVQRQQERVFGLD